MSTQTKLIRQYEVIDRKLVKRIKPLPAMPMHEKTCPVCKKTMYVSDGQLMRTHKQCKKEYKSALREQKKYPHLYK